jgi:NADH:ubiquinone oxidoreductase subunit 4 (subunit M)
MIVTLVIVPLIRAILIMFTDRKKRKGIALLRTVLVFLYSLSLYVHFDASVIEIQYTSVRSNDSRLTRSRHNIENIEEYSQYKRNPTEEISNIEENELKGNSPLSRDYPFLGLKLGIDSLSLYFILLTRFTLPICILCNPFTDVSQVKSNAVHSVQDLRVEEVRVQSTVSVSDGLDSHGLSQNSKEKHYYLYFLLLESLLFLVFLVQDLLSFYVLFESVLIPLFLIVGTYGASTRSASQARIRARFLLFLYTLLGSLFILLSFLTLYYLVGSTEYAVLQLTDLSFEAQK